MTVHTFPLGDAMEHDLEGTDCPCGPEVLDGQVVHHSLDGREDDEG